MRDFRLVRSPFDHYMYLVCVKVLDVGDDDDDTGKLMMMMMTMMGIMSLLHVSIIVLVVVARTRRYLTVHRKCRGAYVEDRCRRAHLEPAAAFSAAAAKTRPAGGRDPVALHRLERSVVPCMERTFFPTPLSRQPAVTEVDRW